ncbi:M14 family zinc carboxypeptidase [Epilithonimonas zeae]|uniref:carboxypeptidase T n=1 Tax=Epilithonimonas zeae TaxID=1416779 RepID=A0A1N6JLW5_9FLAO|nr:M14 family zinc carboxypeptidase [Epilithonimonas zeae]SIO45167.1 Por secretion system C-terminal sorting domain-containing protein [Epilithonimonas zeae]
MKNNLLFLFLTCVCFTKLYSQSEQFSKIKIPYSSQQEFQKILEIAELDHFKGKKGHFVETIVSSEILEKLKSEKFQVKILDENVIETFHKKYLEEKNTSFKNFTPACNGTYSDPVNYRTGSMAGFLNYNEVFQDLTKMHTLYPNLITDKAPISTFKTAENRDIFLVKLSNNQINTPKKKLLFTALHHAREAGSMQQLIYFMWYLLENYASDPEIKTILDKTELYIVPIVNPDGFFYNWNTNPNGGGMWRKNRRNNGGSFGVDNNRNYDARWGTTGISTNPTSDTYCGPAPFSEPENQAIKWLCEQNQFIVAINNHTFSGLMLFPYGFDYDQPTPDHDIFTILGDEMVKKSGYINQLSSALYPTSGSSDDWMYDPTPQKPKIFAYTPENGFSFWDTPSQVSINNRGMLFSNLSILKSLYNYYTIEDKSNYNISGQTFTIDISARKIGLGTGTSAVTLVSNTPGINITNANSNIPDSAQGSSTNLSFSGNITESPNVGDLVSFSLKIDNGDFVQTIPISKIFGTSKVLLNDEGNTMDNWNKTGSWGITNAASSSSPSSITDSPNGNYANGSQTSITSKNSYNLTNVKAAWISFKTKWNIENGYDSAIFEVSDNGGSTWQTQCGEFTNLGSADQLINQPLYDGKSEGWKFEKISLSNYIGKNIKIRFRLIADQAVTEDGIYLDDIKLEVIENFLNVNETDKKSISIYPNPVKSVLSIISSENKKSFEIYALDGKLLKTGKINSNKIDVSNLNSGEYLLKLDNEKVIKFIKK